MDALISILDIEIQLGHLISYVHDYWKKILIHVSIIIKLSLLKWKRYTYSNAVQMSFKIFFWHAKGYTVIRHAQGK